MTPLIGFAWAIENAFRDLGATSARLPTFHDECWLHAAPNPDRPTPHRDPSLGPDTVKAIKRDCGLGDERARQAWAEMIDHLERAERIAAIVLCASLGMEQRSVEPYRPTSLVDAQSGVARIRNVLRHLQRLHAIHAGTGPTAPTVGGVEVDAYGVDVKWAHELAVSLMGPRNRPNGSCFEHIHQAMFRAQRVVREVGTGKPPAACPQCRRLGSIGQPRKGGLCFACDKRNQRSKRPTARVRQTTVRAWKRSKAEAS